MVVDGAFIVRIKYNDGSDEVFWNAPLVTDKLFWKAFFQEYGENDIAGAMMRSMAIKFLCNEEKIGAFDNNRYGGLFVGSLDEEGKYALHTKYFFL